MKALRSNGSVCPLNREVDPGIAARARGRAGGRTWVKRSQIDPNGREGRLARTVPDGAGEASFVSAITWWIWGRR
jgi:hypothetical protein